MTEFFVAFLLDVGRWAMSELSQIWKLKRGSTEIDLSQPEPDKQELERLVNSSLSSRSKEEQMRMQEILERKRKSRLEIWDGLTINRDEYRAQRRTREAYEANERDYLKSLQQVSDEIVRFVKTELNIDVSREKAE